MIIVISIWAGFWRHNLWGFLENHIEIITTYQFSRFVFLLPLLWYLLLALSFAFISNKLKHAYVIVIAVTILQANNLLNARSFSVSESDYPLTFEQYLNFPLFNDIKNFIGLDTMSYRVVSYGPSKTVAQENSLSPTVAQMNGFYTLDGYLSNYPLAYKNNFVKLFL